jgi:hypothetical protein
MNTSIFRQRLWRALQKNEWKYVSRTEDPEISNKIAMGTGIATGFGSLVLTAYNMDDWKVNSSDRRTPFVEAWYLSGCVGSVVGLANAAMAFMPWTALAFYGTGLPVWAVRKWKQRK